MKIQIRRLTPTATLPTYATDGAAGMDLYADEDDEVCLGAGPVRVRTGIALSIPPGYEAQVRPRSGLSSAGVVVALGTIDSDYRGEVMVVMSSSSPHSIYRGNRIAQLIIAPVVRAELVEVDDLDETARGAGGFGSTGR